VQPAGCVRLMSTCYLNAQEVSAFRTQQLKARSTSFSRPPSTLLSQRAVARSTSFSRPPAGTAEATHIRDRVKEFNARFSSSNTITPPAGDLRTAASTSEDAAPGSPTQQVGELLPADRGGFVYGPDWSASSVERRQASISKLDLSSRKAEEKAPSPLKHVSPLNKALFVKHPPPPWALPAEELSPLPPANEPRATSAQVDDDTEHRGDAQYFTKMRFAQLAEELAELRKLVGAQGAQIAMLTQVVTRERQARELAEEVKRSHDVHDGERADCGCRCGYRWLGCWLGPCCGSSES